MAIQISSATQAPPAPAAFLGCPVKTPTPDYRPLSNNQFDDFYFANEYKEVCMQHLRAEYWAFFNEITKKAPNPGWRKSCGKVFKVHGINAPDDAMNDTKRMKIISATDRYNSEKEIELAEELRGHLCIFREKLYFADKCELSCGCGSSMNVKGRCIDHKTANTVLYMSELWGVCSMKGYQDKESATDRDHSSLLYSIGYCEDYFRSYEMIELMSTLPSPSSSSSSSSSTSSSTATADGFQHLPSLKYLFKPNKCEFVTKTHGCWRNTSKLGDNETPIVFNDKLDTELSYEQNAIVQELRKPIEIIAGPPGTGKSTMIRHILRTRAFCSPTSKTLIIAAQNKAVDVLVEMIEPFVVNNLKTSDVGMYVIGNSNTNPNMGPNASKFTKDGLLNQNTQYCNKLNELLSCKKTSKKEQIRSDLSQIEKDVSIQISENSSLIFSTFTGLFSLHKQGLMSSIDTIIVDEAGTVAEWQAIQLCLPNVKGIVFVGDVKQLPPFTHIRDGFIPYGYLERVQKWLSKKRIRVPTLIHQYRMHPTISKFISEYFYENKLNASSSTTTYSNKKDASISGLYWLDYVSDLPSHKLEDRPHLYQTNYIRKIPKETRTSKLKKSKEAQEDSSFLSYEESWHNSYSFVNATEINHVINGVKVLMGNQNYNNKSIKVISFYKPQVEILQSMLYSISESNPIIGEALENGRLTIQTVDSAQGSEADIVILSCVRSNEAGVIGFLGTSGGCKRLCVALSRARQALFIIGDKKTLANSKVPSLDFDTHMTKSLKVINSFDQFSEYGSLSILRGCLSSFGGAEEENPDSSENDFEIYEDDFM
mmetsp:Transcript_1310/g.1692  ORF Transcript_1310/g.1692 Transcript_1310/m.1692 type:complete len:822 (-) Transcript_1310:299-2764(-)|eukprot:CAMPEP_0114344576 /NCGR_PEP_ID=MMETSP0101-20121206/11527_1 /TAXON_ID=38822 ORGANISM="Pteridomonas danica, Strain PT" /NCGR_SAMPLE_ID=MMETSP0101 /ASSEMBLY_ACC=CAM_ASM_000211 /LENGTH=821 /DNA_ID=CAMNT_0001480001 /DNA_START=11 /DNA_END=2476 /DNA_ORIENTATION=+